MTFISIINLTLDCSTKVRAANNAYILVLVELEKGWLGNIALSQNILFSALSMKLEPNLLPYPFP